jgi:hypothetical protein
MSCARLSVSMCWQWPGLGSDETTPWCEWTDGPLMGMVTQPSAALEGLSPPCGGLRRTSGQNPVSHLEWCMPAVLCLCGSGWMSHACAVFAWSLLEPGVKLGTQLLIGGAAQVTGAPVL